MAVITKFESINYFETKRLIAKKITAEDLEKLYLTNENPQVTATLGGILSRAETQQRLARSLTHWQQHGFGQWIFYLKTTKEFIGRGGIRRLHVGGSDEVEVGYILMPTFWGQGYATEIAQASIEIAFEFLRLKDLVAFTLPTNLASQSAMKKAGFKYERDIIHDDLPHVLFRLNSHRVVNIVAHDDKWEYDYQAEAQKIQTTFGSLVKALHHIGSTAINDMPAKPIIDILIECESLRDITILNAKLTTLNYIFLKRNVIPHYSFFTSKEEDGKRYHLHIYEQGDPQVKRHVHFRDYLNQHPQDAKSYADTKLQLAKKYFNGMLNYVKGKDEIVKAIDIKAMHWEGRHKEFLPPLRHAFINRENLIKSIIANFNVHMTYFAQYLTQLELIRIPGYTIVNSGLLDDTFNYVLDADFTLFDVEQKIAELTNYFKQKNLPFTWWVSPDDKPDELSQHLLNSGYKNTANNMAMYLDLDHWQKKENKHNKHAELKIIRALDEKSLQDFALVYTNNNAALFKKYFSWIANILSAEEPIEYYVGYIDKQPVVRGLLCFYAGIAGLYWLSTAPDARRQGFAAEMQRFCLKRAKQLGYHIAYLQSTTDAHALNQKIGFKDCCVFKEYNFF